MENLLDPGLAGASVIVTGGGRGIGRGIAECFLAAGADVTICGRNGPESLPRAGDAEASFVTCDVRDPEQVARLVDETHSRTGRLDVVVNNAGGSPPAAVATASPRFITSVVALNLLGPLFVAQRAFQHMDAQPDGGSIINIASISGIRPSPGTAPYGAAKAGLLNLTETLAMEWAPRVRVNAVTPGLIRTESSAASDHYGADGGQTAGSTVPLGRMGEPAEIGAACLFLASRHASFITGTNLVVHGGGERPPFLDAVAQTASAPRQA